MNNRLINTKVAGGGGGCTDIVDNYDPFGGNGVALYQLNGNANDVSGNYNGTASNVTYGTGVFGQAGVFNGSSSYISTGIPIDSYSERSYSFWFKQNINTGYSRVFGGVDGSATNGGMFRIREDNGDINYYSIDNTIYTWTYPLTNDVWTYISLTDNGTTAKLYINGSEITNVSTASYSTVTNTNLQIGRGMKNTGAIGDYTNGSIDQVRIFDTALTPLEVEALYTEELCICDGTVDTLDILGDGSCIATYQLDGNANDLSGQYSGEPTDVSYGVGEFDLAGVFNGSSSYVNTGINLNSNSGSVSCWVKTTNGTKENFLGVLEGSNRFYFGVRESNFHLGAGSTQKYTVSAANLLDGNWHHVVYSLNGSLAVYYLDGQVADSTSYSGGGAFTLNAFIGALNNSGIVDNKVDGSIDQVRIFNKALNSTEVTTLYNETACTKAACTGTTNTLDILGDGSCIAAFPLDGSPADLSGNYNGVQTDVTYPQGYFDLAGSFNGSSSYINLGTGLSGLSGILNQKVSQSVSFWMNTSFTGISGNSVIYSVYYGNGISLNVYYLTDGTLLFFTRYSGNVTSFTTTQTFNDGNWHHIAVSIDVPNLERKVYIDNTLESTQALSSSAYGGSGLDIGVALGTNGNFNTQYYKGKLDQVRVFNKVLSAGEVTTLYNETACN